MTPTKSKPVEIEIPEPVDDTVTELSPPEAELSQTVIEEEVPRDEKQSIKVDEALVAFLETRVPELFDFQMFMSNVKQNIRIYRDFRDNALKTLIKELREQANG